MSGKLAVLMGLLYGRKPRFEIAEDFQDVSEAVGESVRLHRRVWE